MVASGTPPLSYQGQKDGTNISGATPSSYTAPATTTADNGATFAVVVSNSAGSVTSNSATLTLPPRNPTKLLHSLPSLRILFLNLAIGSTGDQLDLTEPTSELLRVWPLARLTSQ